MNLTKQNINRYLTAIFLIAFPLFFLPGSVFPLGQDAYAKMFFLIAGVSILFFHNFSISPVVVQERKRLVLVWPLLLFVVLYLLTFFSGNFSQAFWGQSSAPLLPGVALLCFFVLHILLARSNVRSESIMRFLTIPYIASVVLLFFEYILRWTNWLISRPESFDFFRKMFGSYEDIAMYLALMSILVAGKLFFHQNKQSGAFKKILLVTWLLAIFLIININYLPAWWCFFLGTLVLFLLEKKYFSGNKKSRVMSLLLVLSIAFLILNYFFTGVASTLEQREAGNFRLGYTHSLGITQELFLTNVFLGDGPGSLSENLSQFRPIELNEGPWWNVRFLQTSSVFLNLFLTVGLIGLLSFVYVFFSAFFIVGKSLNSVKPGNYLFFSFFAFLITLLAAFVFYGSNLLIWFLLFVALAVLERQFFGLPKRKEKILLSSIKIKQPGSEKIFPIIRIIGLVFIIFIFIFNLKIFTAEMFFRSSVKTNDQETKIKRLLIASQLNSQEERYLLILAKIYKNQALTIQKTDPENQPAFEEKINNALKVVQKAASWGNSVAAFETLGVIYRDISQNSRDSIELAILNFEQAVTLEPSNPVLLTEIGKLQAAKKEWQKAETKFLQAIDLKADYYIAKFELARVLSAQNRHDDALKILADIEDKYNKTEVYYEWGKIEFNRKRYDAAQKKFNQILTLDPQHSNALYALALIFEKNGKTQAAVEYLKKVRDLNPMNIEIRNKIQVLEGR